jgi:hypothetical protein
MKLQVVGILVGAALAGTACGGSSSTTKATSSPSASASASAPAYTPPPNYVQPVPSPTPTPTPGVKEVTFGKSNSITNDQGGAMDLTVQAPTFPKSSGIYNPTNSTLASFTVKAVGVSGDSSITPSDFYVRGADGTRYTYENGTSTTSVKTYGPSLPFIEHLAAGEPAKGVILFDIPGQSGTLVYAPESRPLGEWKF